MSKSKSDTITFDVLKAQWVANGRDPKALRNAMRSAGTRDENGHVTYKGTRIAKVWPSLTNHVHAGRYGDVPRNVASAIVKYGSVREAVERVEANAKAARKRKGAEKAPDAS